MNNRLRITLAIALLFLIKTNSSAQSGDLVLVGIVHAAADVKATEYYVLNDIPDLSIYGLGCANNGGGTDSIEWSFPLDSALAGDRIWVANDTMAFGAYFGFSATYYDPTDRAHNFNGNDAIELFRNGEVVDLYGDVNLDGVGEAWRYDKSWAQRHCTRGPDSVFVLEDWIVASLNVLDDTPTNADAEEPYPLNTYMPTPCEIEEEETHLVITEIMYNSPGEDIEFLELYNNSEDSLDLTGAVVDDGIDYTFPSIVLAPGEYMILTDNLEAYTDFYGGTAYEWEGGSLSNGGETILISSSDGDTLDIVTYNDEFGWSRIADGMGASLILCDPDADNNDSSNWQRSVTSTGQKINGVEVYANPGVGDDCIESPIISTVVGDYRVMESQEILEIEIYVDNPSTTATEIEVNLEPLGSAVRGSDFEFLSPSTIVFEVINDSILIVPTASVFLVSIIDDNEEEPEEHFTLTLDNTTNDALMLGDAINVSIIDNDAPLTNALRLVGIVSGHTEDLPKAVELYASENIPNLSLFGLGSANNGNGSDGQEYTFPNVMMSEGDCIIVANDTSVFRQYFDLDADFQVGGAISFNGDDAIELFENGEVIDVFGEIDVDGTGEAWEYSASWAHRTGGTGPNGGDFEIDNWEFGGVGVLVDTETNDESSNPYPVQECHADNVEDLLAEEVINLYPNPVKDQLTIESEVSLDRIAIRDAHGREHLTLRKSDTSSTIDLSTIASGVYIISFTSEGRTWSQKLVIID